MKKRIFAALAAGMLASAALVSCGNSGASSSASSEDKASSAAESSGSSEESPAENSADPAAEAIVNRTETEHLVVSYFTWVGATEGISRIQDKMNELTIPALNIDVELNVTDFASRSQALTLAFSGGEQIDIMYSLGLGLSNAVQNDYLMDLEMDDGNGNQLIETYGKDIIDTMGWDNLNTSRIGGVLYGTSTQHDLAQGRNSILARRQTLEKAEAFMDLTPEYDTNIWKVDSQDDIVTIIKALHDAEPSVTAYQPSASASINWTSIDQLGGNVFGVLTDYGQNTEVVNYFETEEYLNFVKMMYDLNQYGCISPDAVTDTTSDQAAFQAGTINSFFTSGKPDIVTVNDEDLICIQGGPDFTGSTQIGGFCWTIGYTTVDPVAAMQDLNFMYQSPEWNNLFMWGEEGVDYTLNDEGLVVKDDNSDFSHAMQWLSPAEFKAYVQEGNPADLWQQYEAFNDGAIVSKASGFTFDTAPVATQFTAVTNVYNQYQKAIEFGFSDPESSIAEMNAAMKAAGIDDIVAEKQAQLDAWLALQN